MRIAQKAAGFICGGAYVAIAVFACIEPQHRALFFSVVCTGIALAAFGAVKGRLTGINMMKSALQTVLVGGLAAGAAFYLASLFGQ